MAGCRSARDRGASGVPGLSEKQFQQQVTDLCGWLGLRYYHTYDSRRSNPGFPDLLIVGSRTIFVELKSESGRMSRAQREWMEALDASGQEGHVWRPSDFDTVVRVLRELAHWPVA